MKPIAIVAAVIALCTALVSTALIRRLAYRFGVLDAPTDQRKIHKVPTPLLGGIAVIIAFMSGVCVAWPAFFGGDILPKHLIGVCIAVSILAIGGAWDDRKNLPPHVQIVFPVLACLVVVASGIGISYITNPFGGTIPLDHWRVTVFVWNGLPYGVTLFADLFTCVWLLGMMYTTKFLDGLDGLVSGVSAIGMLIIVVLSLLPGIFQPETATLSLIGAAAFLGFLAWNWNPAKIFLGESGSLFGGFILGVLAIISGAKIATALLIMGIPILDVLWVIGRRLFIEKHSPFQADRKHLHLRLLDAGLSQRAVVMILYVFTAVFGVVALLVQSKEKLIALAVLLVVMFAMSSWIVWRKTRRGGI